MINYTKHSSGPRERDALTDTYDTGNLISGERIAQFETDFCEKLKTEYSCAVSNGTAALHLCAEAVKRKYRTRGKVITTPLTFVATIAALHHAGYSDYRFADIDPESLNIDLNIVETLLKEGRGDEYSGLMIVHFAGNPVNMKDVDFLARKYSLWVIEDVAHALGSGSLGTADMESFFCGDGQYSDCSAFSFHPAKNITTGEGGMVTTKDSDIDRFVRFARSHCMDRSGQQHPWEYDVATLGYNYRMTELQAAMGIVQLQRLDEFIGKRRSIAARYDAAFTDLPGIKIHSAVPSALHSHNLYLIEVEARDRLYGRLRENGVNCQVIYKPLHMMSFYKSVDLVLPSVERYFQRCLALPIFPDLEVSDQENIINIICSFLHEDR